MALSQTIANCQLAVVNSPGAFCRNLISLHRRRRRRTQWRRRSCPLLRWLRRSAAPTAVKGALTRLSKIERSL